MVKAIKHCTIVINEVFCCCCQIAMTHECIIAIPSTVEMSPTEKGRKKVIILVKANR